jgi:uncharacterized repeat protein (TIGR04076 family)
MENQKPESKQDKSERRWRRFQENIGYTGPELEIYRSFPQHAKAMQNVHMFVKNKIVIEVIAANNCGSGYKTGDTFVVDEFGNLVIDECPPRLCVGAIAAFRPLVSRMWQALYNGSTEVFQDTERCPDVGVHHSGTGEVVLRIRAVSKE